MKNDLISRGIFQNKIFIVPNGVDSTVFENNNRDLGLVSSFGLDKRVVFGYIGQFYDFEGIEDLILAFAKLHQEVEGIALLLVGGGENEIDIKKRVNFLNVKDVILTGKLAHENVSDYYALMDVMVYPRKKSRLTELTTPLKPLEAMAFGKPVICSSVGGLVELVGIDNALYFRPGNVNELIQCCMHLIRNPLLRKRIGEKGRNRALRERAWENIVTKYVDTYDL